MRSVGFVFRVSDRIPTESDLMPILAVKYFTPVWRLRVLGATVNLNC